LSNNIATSVVAFQHSAMRAWRSERNVSFLIHGRTSLCAKRKKRRKKKDNTSTEDSFEEDWGDIFVTNNNYKSEEPKWDVNDDEKRSKKLNKSKRETRKIDPPIVSVDVVPEPKPLIKTLPGGQSLLFKMVRKLWHMSEFNDYEYEYDGGGLPRNQRPSSVSSGPIGVATSSAAVGSILSSTDDNDAFGDLPRWRPFGGVSPKANDQFRLAAPKMTTEGYYNIIRRNSRKKGRKASLWRYALRTYDKCVTLEREEMEATNSKDSHNNSNMMKPIGFKLVNGHHEAALVACAKLGDWIKAIEVVKHVQQTQKNEEEAEAAFLLNSTTTQDCPTSPTSLKLKQAKAIRKKAQVQLTGHMLHSLVRSCIRASLTRSKTDSSTGATQIILLEERRQPIDAACEFIRGLDPSVLVEIDPNHINPLAAAYQEMGLLKECENLICEFLTARPLKKLGAESFDSLDAEVLYADEPFQNKTNVPSYSIMVQNRLQGIKRCRKQKEQNWYYDTNYQHPEYIRHEPFCVGEVRPDYLEALLIMKQMQDEGLRHRSKDVNLWHEKLMKTNALPKPRKKSKMLETWVNNYNMQLTEEVKQSYIPEEVVLKALEKLVLIYSNNTAKQNFSIYPKHKYSQKSSIKAKSADQEKITSDQTIENPTQNLVDYSDNLNGNQIEDNSILDQQRHCRPKGSVSSTSEAYSREISPRKHPRK